MNCSSILNGVEAHRSPSPGETGDSNIRLIPPDWEVVRLDTVARRGSGHTPDKGHPEYWGGNIKWISLADSDRLDRVYIGETSQTITPAGIAHSSANIHPKGTVVLSRDAGIGKSAIMSEDMAVSQHFMAWRCGPRLDNHYLYYWLQSRKPEFERIAAGNTIKTIGLPYFKLIEIPLPTIEEQRAIAAALLDVDASIGSLDKLLAKKRSVKLAVMQRLLTGRIRLRGYGKDKAAPGLHGTPTDWKCVPLGALGHWRGGLTPSMSDPENWVGGTIPWVSSGDVRGDNLSATGSSITPRALANTAVPLLPSDSVLVVMRSGILRRFLPVVRITREMAINQDIKALPPNSALDSRFLQQMIEFRQNEILARCLKAGTTVESIETAWFKAFEIALPGKEEQTAIADVISDTAAEIGVIERRREKLKQMRLGISQQLLTGRIRLLQQEVVA